MKPFKKYPSGVPRFTFHVLGCDGFALIEFLVVIGIVALITVFVFTALGMFRGQADLDGATEGVLSALRQARAKTLASADASSYGVRFESATYTLFMGRAFNSADPANEAHALPDSVEIFSIALSTTTQSVVFDRLTGFTSTTGTIALRPVANPTENRAIRITASGDISLSAPGVAELDTRITDTRHSHFDLGWSIQNATVLRLRFSDPPNPDITNDIEMTPAAPRSTFAYEGDTNVYGQNQHLRVEAHSIDAAGTLLSVRRRRDQNNRALAVSVIDSIQKDVVSYAADGAATVQAYGGVMTIQ